MKRRSAWPEKESDLAEAVVQWLESQNWEVYQEVIPILPKKEKASTRRLMGRDKNRADIVAVKRGKVDILWIIECKKSMSLEVIQQAHYWKSQAHYVSVCIPQKTKSTNQSFGENICKNLGIGVIQAHKQKSQTPHVFNSVEPKLNRQSNAKKFIMCLREEQRNFSKAGNAENLFWTPFKNTALQIQKIALENPEGIVFSEVMKLLKHHYKTDSTARSCLPDNIRKNFIPGVELKTVDSRLKLFPTKQEIVVKEMYSKTVFKSGDSKVVIE